VPDSKLESANSLKISDESIANQRNSSKVEPGAKRVLLMHYPVVVNTLNKAKYDLILAGHAHGGQVRLPLWGAVIVPFAVDGYELGNYMTEAGRLHVSSGIGTFFLPVRFFCRPEITLIEL
jgi:predicted MPP superfamily phosphohydrolase